MISFFICQRWLSVVSLSHYCLLYRPVLPAGYTLNLATILVAVLSLRIRPRLFVMY